MKARVNQIKEGYILLEDVVVNRNQVIIRKNTVITNELIQVLKAYLVKEIEVQVAKLVSEQEASSEKQEVSLRREMDGSFISQYLQVSEHYKEMYLDWGRGAIIQIGQIREILLPLLEGANHYLYQIFSLHHYSTKEAYIYQHPVAVSLIANLIGRNIGLSKGECIQLAIAGFLIDCGMCKINPSITLKKGTLSKDEYEEIKKHPIYSYQMVKNISTLNHESKLAILQHHERMDGSGYPLKIGQAKIHTFSQILAVADVYHAMTSERVYRKKQSPFKVLEEMTQDSFGKFDIQYVQALIKAISNFSVGTKVRLTNNEIGEIVFINPQNPIRPLIKMENNNNFVNLLQHVDLYIDEVI
ncbi:HD-GYP domain-containing protein [Bacillus songklensis]|uniref:HD-GYP domain-containing protein n=1 Tax=Bacillus songklensis TaxID=1069116 RepID=A0ABV8BAY7_9BACI